jgi:hypothetical protein
MKPRKPQPWDALRTRVELEIYAHRKGYSMQWVAKILDARLKTRKTPLK